MYKKAFTTFLALFFLCVTFSGCYSHISGELNKPFVLDEKGKQMSWDKFEQTTLPKLENGVLQLTESDTYALFGRKPNVRQAYTDALSVVANYSVVQIQGAQTQSSIPMNSMAVFKNKIVKLRGAVWSYTKDKGSKFRTPISDAHSDDSDNYLVVAIFYEGKLVQVQAMTEEQARHSLNWTSETLVDYTVQASIYAIPALILAKALTQAATTLGNSAERSANTLAGSVDRGTVTLGNSVDKLSGAVDNAHPDFGKINQGLDTLNNALKGSNINGTVTGPNGTTGTINITVPK